MSATSACCFADNMFTGLHPGGAEIGGNLWRTNTDLPDKWTIIAGIGFGQDSLAQWAGAGHWNDPDMMVVGRMGRSGNPVPTALTSDERITHVTLWSMLAAPLLLGCDLSRLDQFTLDLLTNDQVIDVNQDPLGKQARRVARTDWSEVWSRPLWDGAIAVGLFNRGPKRTEVVARWADLSLRGRHPVRDLWQQKDLGVFDGSFSAHVPAHGAALAKIGKGRPDF
jgi:alpha-galactosidase